MDNVPSQTEQNKDCSFYLEGRCRFGDECLNYHNPNVKPSSVVASKKDTVKKDRLNNESRNKKKIKMRTALDVIHRIQWDDNLPEECFTIGYEDRFEGIQVNLVQCKIGF